MVNCIYEETEFRFHLTHSAHITKSSLEIKLGNLSDTDITRKLLDGTYDIPDDVDNVTVIVQKEITRLDIILWSSNVRMIIITPDDVRIYWKRVRENTGSSISTIHFGLYKAVTQSDKITSFISSKITVIAMSRCPPRIWESGMQVMLEKISGIALGAILLMEADYNFHNK